MILLTVTAVVWLCWRLAHVFWLFATPVSEFNTQSVVIVNTPNESTQRSSGTKIDIFADEAASNAQLTDEARIQSTAMTNLDALRESNLQVTLSAVIASTDPELSGAILNINGTQRVYKIDDTLPVSGTVLIDEIYDKTVVISNNGVREKISLDDEEFSGIDVRLSTPSLAQLPNDRSSIDEDEVRAKLDEFVQITPSFDGRTLSGLVIAPGRNTRLFELFELQAGDMVVAINGESLRGMTSMTSIESALQTAERLELTISRKGNQRQVAFTQELLSSLLTQ
ncbi:MAG: type II secretion system protein GspC [Pseudomonadales bacterium]